MRHNRLSMSAAQVLKSSEDTLYQPISRYLDDNDM